METSKDKVFGFIKQKQHVTSAEVAVFLGVTRQRAHALLSQLLGEDKIIKIGSTAKASYALPEYASKHLEIFPLSIERYLKNINLEEHKVLDDIENHFPQILKLQEKVRDIFTYAFSEMLNNAIEHSDSKNIDIKIAVKDKKLTFVISDFGIGVFKNIMKKKGLKSELEAIQDLLKGKTTTMPKSHSGEGIFFTSKISDVYILESFSYQLIVNNNVQDVFLQKLNKAKTGTRVTFTIAMDSDKHLSDVFKKYSDYDEESGLPAFDKTEIKIKLYIVGGIHVSRSQARRVLHGVEKFKKVIFDFDKVPMVGQAFADEIFRVFHNKYPKIELQAVNMNEAVKFMVDRVDGTNPRVLNIELESE